MAARINALVFLDIQVGLSTVQEEVPLLGTISQNAPGTSGNRPRIFHENREKTRIRDRNHECFRYQFYHQISYQSGQGNQLPPKILVVHRFTQAMISDYKNIKPTPEVQVVMDMDGWGAKVRKLNYYRNMFREPVQFTGFKLFYKNDYREPDSGMMTPAEVMRLKPKPVYIQYQ